MLNAMLTCVAPSHECGLEGENPFGSGRIQSGSVPEPEEDRAYSERLSAISHLTDRIVSKLNNCLTPVICYAQLISQSPGAERYRSKLLRIVEAAQQAREMMEGILGFAGARPRCIETLDLNRIVGETIPIARDLFWLEKGDVSYEVQEGLPSIAGDPHQLVQALLNLIHNAVQATTSNERPILVRVYEGEPATGQRGGLPVRQVTIEVSDRGCGIPKEILPKVLLPFFTTHPESGAGLGLSTVYGIAQAHGGDIEIDSEAGWGTTVQVYLPAVGTRDFN